MTAETGRACVGGRGGSAGSVFWGGLDDWLFGFWGIGQWGWTRM